jgi:hypothetical protein
MSKLHRNTRSLRLDDPLFAVKQRKAAPHEFVIEAIAALSPGTRPMFGCLAVYVAWGTAGIEIGSKERGEIVEAGSQERREESHEVVTRSILITVAPSQVMRP